MHGWLSAAGFLTAWVLAHAQDCLTVCVVIPKEDRCIVPRWFPIWPVRPRSSGYGFNGVGKSQAKWACVPGGKPTTSLQVLTPHGVHRPDGSASSSSTGRRCSGAKIVTGEASRVTRIRRSWSG